MRLEQHDREQFLAEPHVAVLAAPGGDGEPPVAAPLWYCYEPTGSLWILTPTESLKARALRTTGVATLVVDTVAPRTRYVAVGCDVAEERPGTPADQRVLAERYLPPDAVEGFLAFAADHIAAESVFTLHPRRWHAADLTQ